MCTKSLYRPEPVLMTSVATSVKIGRPEVFRSLDDITSEMDTSLSFDMDCHQMYLRNSPALALVTKQPYFKSIFARYASEEYDSVSRT
jgi:hypothetical protein